MKKINKSLLVSYIISCIFLGIYIIVYFCGKYFISSSSTLLSSELANKLGISIVAVFPLLLFHISTMISLILGIINFIKAKEKNVKTKIILMFSCLAVISIIVKIISV